VTASPLTEAAADKIATDALAELDDRIERTVEHHLQFNRPALEGDEYAAAKAHVMRELGNRLAFEN